MKKLLAVIDMQVDFVSGALGSEMAEQIVPAVIDKINRAKEEGIDICFTRDTHGENYLDTQEGRNLPVVHCVAGTPGWQLIEPLRGLAAGCRIYDKPAFGSVKLARDAAHAEYDEIELVGLCTDICVISNAMLLKAALPEALITVDASCCAGVSRESHENALAAMKVCQIKVTGAEGGAES